MEADDDRLSRELDAARARRALPPPSRRRELRERAGLSQPAMARAVGTNPATISRWESGLRNPRPPLLYAYLEVLERLATERR